MNDVTRTSKVSEEQFYCEGCGNPLSFTPRTCCSDFDCGCMGRPIDPPVCSAECYHKAYPHMLRLETQQMLDDIEHEEDIHD